MNSEREIVKRLFESKDIENDVNDKELEEASFEAGGSVYKCAFGKYYKDGEQISRDDYFKAKDGGDVSGSGDNKGSKSTSVKSYKSTGIDFENGDATYFDDPMGGIDDRERVEYFGSTDNYKAIMNQLGNDRYNAYITMQGEDDFKAISDVIKDKKPTSVIKSTNKDFKDFDVFSFEDVNIVRDTNGDQPYYYFSPKEQN